MTMRAISKDCAGYCSQGRQPCPTPYQCLMHNADQPLEQRNSDGTCAHHHDTKPRRLTLGIAGASLLAVALMVVLALSLIRLGCSQ